MIVFEDKIKFNKDAFLKKLQNIATDLKVQPDWIMAVMNSETGGTFNPQIVNKQKATTPGYDGEGKLVKPVGTPDSTNDFERSKYRATGLIQFMPKTAKYLGTSTQQLYKMNNVQQLDYVHKYFLPAKGKMKNFEDVYQYTFYPYSVGKPEDYIFGSEKGLEYAKKLVQQNPLDLNHDGYLTVAEFREFIYKKIPKEFLSLLKKKWKRLLLQLKKTKAVYLADC
ncbi:MAG: transglycosylase SLT domain-containing protein [Bacteroidia bacterium]|jgi:hypothetical protein